MVINAEVYPRDGESIDRLIKRFTKKCKKQEVIEEYLDKTSWHKTKRQKRREKYLKNKYLRRKAKEKFQN